MTAHLRPVDYLIVAAYLAATAYIGLRVARRQKTAAEYFVANRSIPGWAVAFTLMATMVSSVTLVAHPGAVFERNMWNLAWMLMTPLVLVFVAVWVVPFYRRVVRMSTYEYLEHRFGYGARGYASVSFVVGRVIDLGFTLFTTGIAVSVMTGWDIRWVIVGVAAFTCLYTVLGGIEGVIWTDVAQGMVFVGVGVLVLLVLLFRPPGGPAAVVQEAWAGGKLSLGDTSAGYASLFADRPTVWLLMLHGLFAASTSYITQQNMVQRYLVAKTDGAARRGAYAGAVSCVPVWVLFMFIGACLWAFYRLTGATLPEGVRAQPDNILPYFVMTQLPAGTVGLFLAAVLAAAMSTVSGDVNSVATVLTADFYARGNPRATDRRRLAFGRLAAVGGAALACGAAVVLSYNRSQSAMVTILILQSIFGAGILGLFGLGFLTTRTTRRGVYAGVAAAVTFAIWAGLSSGRDPLLDLGFGFRMNPILIGVLSHAILFTVGYFGSMLLGGDSYDLRGLTVWSRHRDFPEGTRPGEAPTAGVVPPALQPVPAPTKGA